MTLPWFALDEAEAARIGKQVVALLAKAEATLPRGSSHGIKTARRWN